MREPTITPAFDEHRNRGVVNLRFDRVKYGYVPYLQYVVGNLKLRNIYTNNI
jgi:hypothetical protein